MLALVVSSTSPFRQTMRSRRRREKISSVKGGVLVNSAVMGKLGRIVVTSNRSSWLKGRRLPEGTYRYASRLPGKLAYYRLVPC